MNHHYTGMFWILNWHWWTTLLLLKLRTLCLLLGTWVGSPVVGAPSSSRFVHLQSLRQQRRQTQLHEKRQILTFQIQKLHRWEVRRWKTQVCSNLLRSTTNWAALKRVSQQGRAQTKGADVAVDDFAENLETLFHGDADQPVLPHTPTELPWSTLELPAALQKLRRNKSPDEHGLVAELLKYSTTDCHTVLLAAFNAILETGVVPGTWQKTVFTMLPKFKRALQPADFRPVAFLRLLYKTFAYMILGRIERQLDKAQPEEQHGSVQSTALKNIC